MGVLARKLLSPSGGYATIEFVGGNTAIKAGATSGDTTIALDSGLTGGIAAAVSNDDLVIAVFARGGSNVNRTLSITDGTDPYTLIDSELYSADSARAVDLRVAYKFVSGDTSTTFGPTGNASDGGAMAVYVFRNVSQSNTLDVAAVPATGNNTVKPNPAGITPITEGAYIVVVGAGTHGVDTQTFSASDLTDFLTVTGLDTYDITIGVGQKIDWTSGEFNAAEFTFSGSDGTGYAWAAMTIALRPASL